MFLVVVCVTLIGGFRLGWYFANVWWEQQGTKVSVDVCRKYVVSGLEMGVGCGVGAMVVVAVLFLFFYGLFYSRTRKEWCTWLRIRDGWVNRVLSRAVC